MPHILGIPHPKQRIVGGLAGKAINALGGLVKQVQQQARVTAPVVQRTIQQAPQRAVQRVQQNFTNRPVVGGAVGRVVQAVTPKIQQYVRNRQQYIRQNPPSKVFAPAQFKPQNIANIIRQTDYNIRTKLLGFGPQLQPPSLPPSFGTAGGISTALSSSPVLARVGNAVLGQAGKIKFGTGVVRTEQVKNLAQGTRWGSKNARGGGEIPPSESSPAAPPISGFPSKNIISQSGGKLKERKFITTVKESKLSSPELKVGAEGLNTPKPNKLLIKQARDLIRTNLNEAYRISTTGTDDLSVATAEHLIAMYDRKGQHEIAIDIANKLAPRLTELGRGVQAAALFNKLSPQGITRFATSVINKAREAGRVIPDLTPQMSARLQQMSKNLQKMPEGLDKAQKTMELLDEINKLVPTPLTDKLVTLWKAGLLTGLKTTGVNIGSNISHGVSEIVKDAPAAAIDSVLSLFTGQRTKTFTLRGGAGGLREGFGKGWQYLKTGFDERNVAAKYDYKKINFGNNPVAKLLQKYEQTIFRSMGAADQPFYYGAKARSLFDQAYAASNNRGLSGVAKKQFVDNFVKNPPEQALKNAVADAEIAVFQNKTALGEVGRAIQKIPVIGPITAPFTRTPGAVAMQIVNYSPAGIAKTIIEQIATRKFNQRQLAQGLGRGLTGTAVLAIGKELYDKGLMNLDAPKNERERRQWELEGRQPNSIKVDGVWRQPQVLGPAGLTLILGGYFQRALQQTGSYSKALSGLGAGYGRISIDQTMLKGLSGVLNAINDPSRYAENTLESTIGSVVPTIIADVARAKDPFQREIEGPADALKARIPGQRESLIPKRNAFGEEVPRRGSFLQVMADPTRPSPEVSAPIISELRRLMDVGEAVTPTNIDRKQGKSGYKFELTQEEQDRFEKGLGRAAKIRFEKIISSPKYQRAGDGDKKKLLLSEMDELREQAKDYTLILHLRNLKQTDPSQAQQEVKRLYESLTPKERNKLRQIGRKVSQTRVARDDVQKVPANAPQDYSPIIQKASATHGVPTNILTALLQKESSFDPDVISGRRKSPSGALGIAQFMPETARELGVNPLDPQSAIDGAARYLSDLYRQFGSWELALAAYNAGPGNVQKYGGIPPFTETQDYVSKILAEAGG